MNTTASQGIVSAPPRQMTQLCALGMHVIQQLPSGRYVCVYECGLQVTEYHALVIGTYSGAAPHVIQEASHGSPQ